MALKLAVTDNRGVVTEYHRISRILFEDKAVVRVTSYSSEQYRQYEKDQKEQVQLTQDKYNQLTLEMGKPDEVKDAALIVALSEEINALMGNPPVEVDCSINSTEFVFDLDKSKPQSYDVYYSKLKSLDVFYGATDI